MTTDGQPLPTARLARGGDFTPDPALYPFASRWLASSVGAMHYSDEGSGPAILFYHGNPTSSSLYRGVIERLRGRFRCVAADLHGFCLSERPVPALAGAASCAVSQPALNAAGVTIPCARCGQQRL